MSRLPIRLRLTAAFALAMVVVLAGAALFVYQRQRSDLDDAIDDGLRTRAHRLATAIETAPGQPGARAGGAFNLEDGFAQVLRADGTPIDSAGGAAGPALSPAEARRAGKEAILLERSVAGIDYLTRVLARPASAGGGQPLVAVVGHSLEDRDDSLANLVASFAIGGPIAVVLASLLGYGLASAGFAPIEAMRRRAGEVSLARERELLPLPKARDEVHRLAQTLNEMLERLRAAFERERSFVADASHELRTPIAVLKTELDGALRSPDLGPEARASIVGAIEECDGLGALAEDLLVLTRAAEGELPVHPQPLPAREILGRVRDRFADRAADRGRTIRVETENGLVVAADPLRMRQALGNLVDNALRHGEGDVVLRAGESADGAELAVSDSGPGFDPAIANAAFERFTRGDRARTRGGAGLGLAIVRAVVEVHGGSVEVVDGAGATVRLRLPAAQGTPPGASAPERRPNANGRTPLRG
jgi:two-component system, OmpR family, sensor kinase